MWKINFKGRQVECEDGGNLRNVLMRSGLSPYNERSGLINCHGMGTCGTCAVLIEGKVSQPTRVERWRLGFPPHKKDTPLRLACQCRVHSDLSVAKYPGFWGQQI